MGLGGQLSVDYFLELCFLQFLVALVLMGLQIKFINNVVFPLRPVMQIL